MLRLSFVRIRNKKNQRQNDYVQHGVEVATVDNAKTVEFDKAKNGSPLNIKKVFGRNKKSKLKNKLIPEVNYIRVNKIYIDL